MLKTSWLLMFPFIFGVFAASAQDPFETDTFKTSGGDLKITFIGHGTLIFAFDGKIIHVDPYGKLADYQKLPKADMVLITHEHRDHLDADALKPIQTDKTVFISTETCAQSIPGAVVMRNGDVKTVGGIKIEAVPAYNILHKRPDGQLFHPAGVGNGYVMTFGDKRVYVAGDTENITEMKGLKNIDVAFLPMNLPYTMTPEMVAVAAMAFKPKILYPYHYGDTDPAKLTALLKDAKDIEVRVRRMK
jgi:L-ascorbate metabolism protein UlaG (beta-lactamase superfamily)